MVIDMKNFLIYSITIISILAIAMLIKIDNKNLEPNTLYEVYLEGKSIGVVKSKKELEDYIDAQNSKFKKDYNVKRIYSPNGLDVEKILTYDKKVDNVSSIYNKIQENKPFTISGYQLTIDYTNKRKSKGKTEKIKSEIIKIYVTDKKVFDDAIVNLFETFVGTEQYEAYVNKTQEKITTTGVYIDNIYIGNDLTIKKMNIPVTEKIYSDSNELTQFLLFGKENKKSNYIVKSGDTIETVAFNNKISTEEFLISNPNFTSSKSLLFPGQQVVIGITDPQIEVVVKESVVKDVQNKYQTIERYDDSKQVGDDVILQKGENGLERVSQIVEIVNGNTTVVTPISKEELKPKTDRIIVYGKKQVSGVGSTKSWGWPTNSGYTITSPYGYRVSPFSRYRELHYGVDISGTGSPVYAPNNGTVTTATYHYSYGNYIVLNHNNGYYTLYAHMSRFAKGIKVGVNVARGQIIGYVGQTGSATGPHLHYEAWRGKPMGGGSRMDPLSLYN